ncbi:hypothetical protein GCM10027612_36590 [Microbispora bryophytorum subsp. camponoti]
MNDEEVVDEQAAGVARIFECQASNQITNELSPKIREKTSASARLRMIAASRIAYMPMRARAPGTRTVRTIATGFLATTRFFSRSLIESALPGTGSPWTVQPSRR